MIIISKINQSLKQLFNIQINRVQSINLSKYTTQRPVHICMAGMPGVGKSTIYNELIEAFFKNRILTTDNFISNVKLENTSYSGKEYETLANLKLNNMINSSYYPSALNKIGGITTASRAIKNDSIIQQFNNQYVVFSDEGLLLSFKNELIELEQSHIKHFVKLMKNRTCIYCFTSEEAIYKQNIKRQKETGLLHPFYISKNEVIMKEKIKQIKKDTDKYITLLEKYIPVLKINTNDNTQTNLEKIITFIQSEH